MKSRNHGNIRAVPAPETLGGPKDAVDAFDRFRQYRAMESYAESMATRSGDGTETSRRHRERACKYGTVATAWETALENWLSENWLKSQVR